MHSTTLVYGTLFNEAELSFKHETEVSMAANNIVLVQRQIHVRGLRSRATSSVRSSPQDHQQGLTILARCQRYNSLPCTLGQLIRRDYGQYMSRGVALSLLRLFRN